MGKCLPPLEPNPSPGLLMPCKALKYQFVYETGNCVITISELKLRPAEAAVSAAEADAGQSCTGVL